MTACANCDGSSKFYIGDIGTEIIVDVCSDITTANVTDLMVEKPDGTQVTWSGAVFETTKIKYVVASGDFDQVGIYTVQSRVVISGWSGYGDTVSFKVSSLFT